MILGLSASAKQVGCMIRRAKQQLAKKMEEWKKQDEAAEAANPPSKKLHQERLHCRAVKVLEAPQLAWTEIPVANRK